MQRNVAKLVCLGALLALPVVAMAGPAIKVRVYKGDIFGDNCDLLRVTSAGLWVRSGPGKNYRKMSGLSRGQGVWHCGHTKGRWYGVIYSRRGRDCKIPSPSGAWMRYRGRCSTGWVSKRYLAVQAG